MLKGKKKKSEDKKKATELNSDMAMILEWLDWEFKITMIDMLRILKEKVNNIARMMDNISRKTETLRRNKKKLLAI